MIRWKMGKIYFIGSFIFANMITFCATAQPDPSPGSQILRSVHVDDVLEHFARSGVNVVADTYVEMNFWHHVPLKGKALPEKMHSAAETLGYQVQADRESKVYVWQYRQWFLKKWIPKEFVKQTIRDTKRSHPDHLTHPIRVQMESGAKPPLLTVKARSALTAELVRSVAEESQVQMRVERELASRRATLFLHKVSLATFRESLANALRARWHKQGNTYVLYQDIQNKRLEQQALDDYVKEMKDKEVGSFVQLRDDIRDSLLESLGEERLAALRAQGKITLSASTLTYEQQELIRRMAGQVNQMAEKQGMEHRIDPFSLERVEMMLGPNGKVRYTCYGRLHSGMATAF
ncbi:MAG: hypothetical protein IT210_24695 [Armatimonadetes bacterium]|nr:hypothetical protein [Armatimonadota bacterium]